VTSSARRSDGDAIRALALIDGEHHPPVVRDALDRLAAEHQIAGVLFAGGGEKAGPAVLRDPAAHYGRPVSMPRGSVEDALRDLVAAAGADAVVDLSGDPVLDLDARMHLAAVALDLGLEYRAPGMRLTPPQQERVPGAPLVAVIGTGKRVGKTAVAGHLGALLRERGERPVIVSMGRGGPAEPAVIRAGEAPGLDSLLALARGGDHASSDYIEDAVLAGVTTVGCRRCGEGPAGEVFDSNAVEGVRLAMELDPTVVVLEGSGAGLPPVVADRTICVARAETAGAQALRGLGPLRLLRSDLVLVTGAERLSAGERDSLLEDLSRCCAHGAVAAARLVPEPARPVPGGARVALFTTAAPAAATVLGEALAAQGVDVAMTSANLSHRDALAGDLAAAERIGCSVFLTELKAAAVDMVAEHAGATGAEVVFLRHRPAALPGDEPLDQRLLGLCADAGAAVVSA
jgi:cyclic 2,3-diphosphoglycerate synthetase